VHIYTKDLPENLRAYLKSLGYAKTDISLTARERVSPSYGGAAGRKGFFAVFNLTTGEAKDIHGSWGGANIANPSNVVDLDSSSHDLPPGVVAISGSDGYGGCDADLYAHPQTIAPLLPAGADSGLTDPECVALYAFRALKGGSYRADFLRENRIGASVLSGLVAKGMLKEDKAGKRQITTVGKNALESAKGRAWSPPYGTRF
jgi:hypothetical protein